MGVSTWSHLSQTGLREPELNFSLKAVRAYHLYARCYRHCRYVFQEKYCLQRFLAFSANGSHHLRTAVRQKNCSCSWSNWTSLIVSPPRIILRFRWPQSAVLKHHGYGSFGVFQKRHSPDLASNLVRQTFARNTSVLHPTTFGWLLFGFLKSHISRKEWQFSTAKRVRLSISAAIATPSAQNLLGSPYNAS